MAASLWSRCTRGNCSNVGYLQPLFTKATDSVWLPAGLVTALLIIEAVLAVVMNHCSEDYRIRLSGGSAVGFLCRCGGSASICFVHCNSCCSYLRQSSWQDALAATKGDASMGFSHDNFRSPALSLGRYASATNLPELLAC